jgi:hypothetical protein
VTVADKPAASATLTCVHRPPPNQSQVKASEAVARQPSATSAAVHVGTECNKPTRRVHPRSKRGWQGRLRSLLQCSWSIAGAPALVTAVRCHRRDTAALTAATCLPAPLPLRCPPRARPPRPPPAAAAAWLPAQLCCCLAAACWAIDLAGRAERARPIIGMQRRREAQVACGKGAIPSCGSCSMTARTGVPDEPAATVNVGCKAPGVTALLELQSAAAATTAPRRRSWYTYHRQHAEDGGSTIYKAIVQYLCQMPSSISLNHWGSPSGTTRSITIHGMTSPKRSSSTMRCTAVFLPELISRPKRGQRRRQ